MRSCTHLWPFVPGVTVTADSGQVALRHTQENAYRCYLPVLTGFSDLPLHRT